MKAIVIVPIGRGLEVSWLVDPLSKAVNHPVTVGTPIAAPDGAFDRRRQQYLGDALLRVVGSLNYLGAGRVLGIIDADCYAQGLNFIFGQASGGGRDALVAAARLRQTFYGRPEDVRLFRLRMLKECVHELGHTWNLPHCSNAACVMHFSNSLHDTDYKDFRFCRKCYSKLNIL